MKAADIFNAAFADSSQHHSNAYMAGCLAALEAAETADVIGSGPAVNPFMRLTSEYDAWEYGAQYGRLLWQRNENHTVISNE